MSSRWKQVFDIYKQNIINNRKHIESYRSRSTRKMEGGLYREFLNIYNIVLQKNQQDTGCGSCKDKIQRVILLMYTYIDEQLEKYEEE